jgi:elongation factor P
VISTNQFKNGTHIEVDGTIFRIVEFQHVKPGKGGAFVRSKLKRVDDGAVIDKTFKAGEKFRPVRTETRKMQFLYDSGTSPSSWTTRATTRSRSRKSVVGDALKWVPPNSTSICCSSTSARPGPGPERGRSRGYPDRSRAEGRHRLRRWHQAATLETGVVVQVPLFIEEGERVRVDTRSAEYVSRA